MGLSGELPAYATAAVHLCAEQVLRKANAMPGERLKSEHPQDTMWYRAAAFVKTPDPGKIHARIVGLDAGHDTADPSLAVALHIHCCTN